MKKNLIVCPNCLSKGITQVLGEIDQFGHFLVMRFHKGMTRIIGGNFAVACGKCGELVYIKKGGKNEGASFNHWFVRVSRFSTEREVGTGRISDKKA